MESAAVYISANQILRRAFAEARHSINRRLAVQRMGTGMALALCLCFLLLPLLLLTRTSVMEIIIAMALLNVITMVIWLWRGSWAGQTDAAIYLEHKYGQPGLFITAAQCAADNAEAAHPEMVPLLVLYQAARVCQRTGTQRVKAIPWPPAIAKIWAGNGLLLMGLFIVMLLGRSMLASSSTMNRQLVHTGITVQRTIALRRPHQIFPTKVITPAPRSALLPAPGTRIADRTSTRVIDLKTLENIQHTMARILHAHTAPSAATARHNPQTDHETGATLRHRLAALQSQLLAVARLPGIGAKLSTLLLAGAHAVHASSQGDIAPQLRSVNHQLKAYLSSVALQSESHSDHRLARMYEPQYGRGGVSGKALGHADYSLRAGNSQQAVIMNIPPARHGMQPRSLSWVESYRGHTTMIPTPYRYIVRRYFSRASNPQ